MNNQKIKITDFLDNIESIIIKENFLSSTINNIKKNNYNYPKINKNILSEKDEINDAFMCIEHNKKYEYFVNLVLKIYVMNVKSIYVVLIILLNLKRLIYIIKK